MGTELCRAVLFDWGGTLACVRREDQVWVDCARAAVDALATMGHSLPQQAVGRLSTAVSHARARVDAVADEREVDLHALLQSWLDTLGADGVAPATLDRAASAFWQRWTLCLDPLDQADHTLSLLRQRRYVLGVVSNVIAPANHCLVQLRRLGLAEHLSTFTFSSEVGVRKPRREMYEDALHRLRLHFADQRLPAGDVLFVGDSPICDVAGPARMGMRTALLAHPDIVSPWPASDYQDIEPTCHLTRLNQLLEDLPGPP